MFMLLEHPRFWNTAQSLSNILRAASPRIRPSAPTSSGMVPTSALFTGEGDSPLNATGAARIEGSVPA